MAVLTSQRNETAEKVTDGGDEIHKLVVIQDQRKMLVDLVCHFIDQAGKQSLGILVETGDRFEDGVGTFPEGGEALCQGCDQVGDETLRVLVEAIKREPADRQPGLAGEIHQQGGLAVPGRGGDEDQLFFQQVVETRQ
jgi:hypothetical protein